MKHLIAILIGIVIGVGIALLVRPAKAGNYLTMTDSDNVVVIQTTSITRTSITNVDAYTGSQLSGRFRLSRTR